MRLNHNKIICIKLVHLLYLYDILYDFNAYPKTPRLNLRQTHRFNSIIDKYQNKHFLTFNTLLVWNDLKYNKNN